MPAKSAINALLYRLSGHHLTKGAPGASIGALRRELETSSRELQATRRELQTTRGKLQTTQRKLQTTRSKLSEVRSKVARHNAIPVDYDCGAKEIIEAVGSYTMTVPDKVYGLIQAVRYVAGNGIPGEIVECGVWRGGSMQAIARTLLEAGDTSRNLYLFDTFEGMTEPTDVDLRWDGTSAAELLAAADKSARIWAFASLDDVKAGLAAIPYPQEKVHYVVGKVEDTIPDELPDQISILRLDTDWYESTKHELDHAYSRLSPGGVLIIDDYGQFLGAKKATDEFLAALDEPILLNRINRGRIAVKPFPHPA